MSSFEKKWILRNYGTKLGKIVVKQYKDKYVITAFPDRSKVVYNEAQLSKREQFKQAVAFAQKVKANPTEYKQLIKKLPKSQSIYHAVIKAYMQYLIPDQYLNT